MTERRDRRVTDERAEERHREVMAKFEEVSEQCKANSAAIAVLHDERIAREAVSQARKPLWAASIGIAVAAASSAITRLFGE